MEATQEFEATASWASSSERPMADTRSVSLGSLKQKPRPAPAQQQHMPGLYEVNTGLAPLRTAPRTSCPGIGVLKGGHRFYAVPFHYNGYEWLKMQTEDVSPPLFSPQGLSQASKKLPSKLDEMYSRSIPPLASSSPALPTAKEVWIRKEEKTITFIRPARSCRSFETPEHDQSREDAVISRMQKASQQMTNRIQAHPQLPVVSKTKKEWSKSGSGSWTNMLEYGMKPHPNLNCGRWRQLQDEQFRGSG
eukprot:gb/GFBE01030994.1/.p1 GENE.gb/GFBE01030994.1/~~gb/GFBE01030994.1/.p1  ORF type:complete len:249 (+),score=46.61 gb/GFBE01030994.1/:1-747(+)